MTTVTAGDYEFEVDVEHEDISIVFRNNGHMTVMSFTCDGFMHNDRKGVPIPLFDYLMNKAREANIENAAENFASGQTDYTYANNYK